MLRMRISHANNPTKDSHSIKNWDKDRAIEAVKRYKVKAGRLRESKDDL